jgi:pyruvate-formate lyase-activating enzyme
MDREKEQRRLNVRVPSHEDDAMAEVMASPLHEQLARFAEWGLPRAGLLIMMSACQGRCYFCASPAVTAPGPEIVTPVEHIERWLAENRELGVEDLLLGGTEPPTHAHFERTLQRAREVGFRRIQLMTSGLALAEPGVAEDWYAAGIRSICVPIYAASAEPHDAVVGVEGHFERLARGLDQARRVGIEPWLHTLALRRTIDRVKELAETTRRRWSARLAVAPLRAKDELFRYGDESVSYAELERALQGADVSLVGFPLCVGKELPRGGAQMIELYFRAQRTVYADVCESCNVRARCPGVVVAHYAEQGAAGLVAE